MAIASRAGILAEPTIAFVAFQQCGWRRPGDRMVADAIVGSDDLWLIKAVVSCDAMGWVVHA